MTIEYAIVPGTQEHVAQVAERMRQEDIDEVWAASHQTPFEGLARSVLVSRDTSAGLVNGRAVCMFGVASLMLLSDAGYPWLLGTTELPRHARKFLRESVGALAKMKRDYAVLSNFVDARNTLSIRWLRWLGFEIKEPIPFGPDRMLFHPFEMRRGNV